MDKKTFNIMTQEVKDIYNGPSIFNSPPKWDMAFPTK